MIKTLPIFSYFFGKKNAKKNHRLDDVIVFFPIFHNCLKKGFPQFYWVFQISLVLLWNFKTGLILKGNSMWQSYSFLITSKLSKKELNVVFKNENPKKVASIFKKKQSYAAKKRKIFVVICVPLCYGVPQGSVQGHLCTHCVCFSLGDQNLNHIRKNKSHAPFFTLNGGR